MFAFLQRMDSYKHIATMADSNDFYCAQEASDELANNCNLCYEKYRKYEESVIFCKGCKQGLCMLCYDTHMFRKDKDQDTCYGHFKISHCDKHKNKITNVFCTIHCDIMCVDCWLDFHPDCAVKPLKGIRELDCHRLRNAQTEFVLNIRTATEQIINDLEEQRKSYITNILTTYHTIVSKLKNKLERSKIEVDIIFEKKTGELQELLKKIEQDFQTFDSDLHKIERDSKLALSHIHPMGLAHTFQRMRINSRKVYEPTTAALMVQESWINFNKSSDELFFKEQFAEECHRRHFQDDSKKNMSVTVQTKWFSRMETEQQTNYKKKEQTRQTKPLSVTEARTYRLEPFLAKIDSDKDICCITGLCVTKNGSLLMSDCYNKSLKLFSNLGKNLATCSLDGEPWDVAITGDNQIAVTLWDNQKTIQILKLTDNTLQLENAIRLKNRVYGITAVDYDMAITCDDTIPSVMRITKEGNIQWKKEFDAKGNKLFVSPSYIISGKIKETSCLLVSDKEKHVIVVLEAKTGKVLTSFNMRKAGPNGMSFDSVGNLFVGYSFGGGIFLYAPDFEKHNVLLTVEHRPQAVVFNPWTSELLFSSWKSDALERFRIFNNCDEK